MGHRSRGALVAVIAAQWLAIIGGVLVVWWLLLGGNLGHLASGGASLALAMATGTFALNLAGMLRH
jgi:hypothetical protein